MYSIIALNENTRFAFLPHDILLHIISFNEIRAVLLIQKKAKAMLVNKINAVQDMIVFAFESNMGIDMVRYNLFYNNRIISKKEVVETFDKCNCCERHKINRPKKLAPWVDTPFHSTQDTNCNCRCRHLSRFICRQIM